MNFLEASKVVKQYSNHLALDKVSISVPQGSIFGLLGPNGAGKTTLIRIINQITAPDEGAVYLKGEKLKQEDISQIGYLPEERGLYRKMRVGDQSLYLARLKGMSRNDAMKRLKYWFEKFEITSWWPKKVEELSKGMQQKLQFITTVIHEPSLLIFDEPFSGFDPINANILKNEILEQKKRGATIIFSTHNMASVEELCDHISLINKSRVILEGQIDEIRKTYRTNSFEVSYKGQVGNLRNSIPPGYEIMEEKSNHELNFAIIKSTGKPDNNLLISKLLPVVELHSFSEIIPNMNDVFIRVVEGANSEPT